VLKNKIMNDNNQNIKFSGSGAGFTEEEKQILNKYVTSTEDNVFAIKNLPGIVGAAYARYSRAKGGFRETLLKEFIKEGHVDPKHADELIARVLVAYGDDSVGELEGTHVSFEKISMLATKEIEDRRIGGSPIEQSTRYVFYDQKVEHGNWLYYRGEDVKNSTFGKDYLKTMDFIFETYASLVEPMKAYFEKLKSIEMAEYDINGDGVKEKWSDLQDEALQKAFKTTYNFDLRSKACDTLRCLLPLSTLTNVGMFGNGRFFQTLISHLITTDIPEVQDIGIKTLKATSEVIPQYVKRGKRNEYVVANRNNMFALVRKLFGESKAKKVKNLPQVELLKAPSKFDIQILASMLFPFANKSIKDLRTFIKKTPEDIRQEIARTYLGERKTRRDRPGRALEEGYPYTFEMVTNWGVYKDLMRHRMNTQQRQLFTTELGFDMPEELKLAGFEEQAKQCVSKSRKLFKLIAAENPLLAQYAVLHGNFVRWTMGLNDRAAMHLIELRTTPQGHPQYRKVGQMMHQEIAKVSKWRAEAMKFVDYNDYYWSRADSEAKQRVKEAELDKKYDKQ